MDRRKSSFVGGGLVDYPYYSDVKISSRELSLSPQEDEEALTLHVDWTKEEEVAAKRK
jgi:hypothetical protein